jgi:probable phosphoglycerate mutase
MRLYLIRHAEPAYPRDALTARGHRQARALARRLDPPGADLGIGRVYSSPMNRALETAAYTAKRLGLEVEVEPWACELEDWWIPDEAAGELPAWQVDAPILRALGREDWYSEPPLDAPHLRQGFEQLCADADAFLARQGCRRDGGSYRLEGPPPNPGIALFCHAGLALTWLAHLLAIPLPLIWAGFSLPPASVTTVHFETLGGGAAARCLGLGDVGLQPP